VWHIMYASSSHPHAFIYMQYINIHTQSHLSLNPPHTHTHTLCANLFLLLVKKEGKN
jgi:hypothetical protein